MVPNRQTTLFLELMDPARRSRAHFARAIKIDAREGLRKRECIFGCFARPSSREQLARALPLNRQSKNRGTRCQLIPAGIIVAGAALNDTVGEWGAGAVDFVRGSALVISMIAEACCRANFALGADGYISEGNAIDGFLAPLSPRRPPPPLFPPPVHGG